MPRIHPLLIAHHHNGIFKGGLNARGKELGQLVDGISALLVGAAKQQILRRIKAIDARKGGAVGLIPHLMLAAPHDEIVLAVIVGNIRSRALAGQRAARKLVTVKRIQDPVKTPHGKGWISGNVRAIDKGDDPQKLQSDRKALGAGGGCGSQVFGKLGHAPFLGRCGIAQQIRGDGVIDLNHSRQKYLFFGIGLACQLLLAQGAHAGQPQLCHRLPGVGAMPCAEKGSVLRIIGMADVGLKDPLLLFGELAIHAPPRHEIILDQRHRHAREQLRQGRGKATGLRQIGIFRFDIA